MTNNRRPTHLELAKPSRDACPARRYWDRKAAIGSTFDARRAGT